MPHRLFRAITDLRRRKKQHHRHDDCETFRPRIIIPEDGGLPGKPNASNVQEVLREGQKDLGEYDAEISRLKSRIQVIEDRKSRLRKYLENCSSLTSPIAELPNEILDLIFTVLCDEYATLHIGKLEAWPLRLSAVSSRWRSVVRSNPLFWSKIRVEFSKQRMPSFRAVQLFLERSKDVPLFLYICFKHKRDESQLQTNIEHQALQALAREAQRWKELTLSGDDPKDLCILRYTVFESLPELAKLVLTGLAQSGGALGINGFVPMPKLKSLTTDKALDASDFMMSFNWRQLYELNLSGSSNALSFLKLCTKLKNLQWCIDPQDFVSPLSQAVHHKYLENLTLLMVPSGKSVPERTDANLETLFRTVTFPALAMLTIQCDSAARHGRLSGPEPPVVRWSSIAMSSFIDRCSCTLTSLFLIDICISDIELITFLDNVPSLKNLTVREPWFMDGFTAAFPCPLSPAFLRRLQVFPGQSEPILPNLEMLSLTIHGLFNEAIFVEMASSRFFDANELGVVHLKELKLRVGGMGSWLGKMMDMNKLAPLLNAVRGCTLDLRVENMTTREWCTLCPLVDGIPFCLHNDGVTATPKESQRVTKKFRGSRLF
ncbi:hypothetical protein GYMLUDRAFT_38511 [Collybiopsis luxurians FD-317 M1]|nr:hypothetical protein GYMLUDRAFT_38511 [Collybiopsis luxurians FD-317 M1]